MEVFTPFPHLLHSFSGDFGYNALTLKENSCSGLCSINSSNLFITLFIELGGIPVSAACGWRVPLLTVSLFYWSEWSLGERCQPEQMAGVCSTLERFSFEPSGLCSKVHANCIRFDKIESIMAV